jgi:tetratricopeptide (TPR) repeat protein
VVGGRADEAEVLAYRGDLELSAGRHGEALGCYEQAWAIARDIGFRGLQAHARNGAGAVLRAVGDLEPAMRMHDDALAIAVAVGDRLQEARALDGLAQVRLDAGDPAQARRLWRRALLIYGELGVPEAGDVSARLADAAPRAPRPTSR